MWLNPIAAKMMLDWRDPSNLKLHKVSNETVLSLRRKFNFTVEILSNFILMKKLTFSAIRTIQNSPIRLKLYESIEKSTLYSIILKKKLFKFCRNTVWLKKMSKNKWIILYLILGFVFWEKYFRTCT
jgi:hypothetical protein